MICGCAVLWLAVVGCGWSLTVFFRGSAVKAGGRIVQGQFFKARQLALSSGIAQFVHIRTTGSLPPTIQLFGDSNRNGLLDFAAVGVATSNAPGADVPAGELIPLDGECRCEEGGHEPAGPVVAPLAVPALVPAPAVPPPAPFEITYRFLPNGTCARLGTTTNLAAGDCDFRLVGPRSRLSIFVNPAGGKIQRMVFSQ